MPETVRYAIGDLADRGGVSRRTVRYYVQEGLLPAPLGAGRGSHYGPEHLEQLLRVKAMQEAGRTLDDIRALTAAGTQGPAIGRAAPGAAHLARTTWRRIALAAGVELHVAGSVRLPSEDRLQELASWCRHHFPDAAE
jgi:DNA-binding transcriptional MerR regulator